MVKIGTAILLLALSPFDIDHGMFDGVWVGADSNDPNQNHAYLSIDESRSGRFVYMVDGKAVIDFEFTSEDVAEPKGYIEFSKSFGNWGVKAVLSGWVSGEDRGIGMLTGVVYMYQLLDDEPTIFNSHFLRLWALAGPVPKQESNR